MEYQEIMNADVQNIASKYYFWRPIYGVIDNSYFEKK